MSRYVLVSEIATYGGNTDAIASISSGDQQSALDTASGIADSYLRGRYRLPLQTWDDAALKTAVVAIAFSNMMRTRGFNPQAGTDTNIIDARLEAIAWLVRVEKQEVHPNVTPAADQSPGYDAPRVLTTPKRGW